MSQKSPYELLGGEEGVQRLARAFYSAMDRLPEAKTIRAMHKEDLGAIEAKLGEFLTTWLGGPPVYVQKYGGLCLTRAHAPYTIGTAERDQWLLCMNVALEEIGTPAELRDLLRAPFFRIAEFMRDAD